MTAKEDLATSERRALSAALAFALGTTLPREGARALAHVGLPSDAFFNDLAEAAYALGIRVVPTPSLAEPSLGRAGR